MLNVPLRIIMELVCKLIWSPSQIHHTYPSRDGQHTIMWLKNLTSCIHHYGCSTEETFLHDFPAILKHSLRKILKKSLFVTDSGNV